MPVGDQVAFEMRAPGGIAIGFRVPSVAEMIWMPMFVRVVSDRARLAAKSMNTPPSSWYGLENVFIRTGPSPISSRNHCLSAFALVRLMLRYRGINTASASSAGGDMYPSVLRTSSGEEALTADTAGVAAEGAAGRCWAVSVSGSAATSSTTPNRTSDFAARRAVDTLMVIRPPKRMD